MKSVWAKVVTSQSLFCPRISKVHMSYAGQGDIWTVAHSWGRWCICRMAPVAWFCHMKIKWSVLNRRLLFWRECSRLFLGDDDGRSDSSRGAVGLKLVHFMPDVWYELLTTFLGAVVTPLLIGVSDSDFGSEQIIPAAPVSALHPSITYAFLHEKYSKLKSITRVQIASRFLHWNTRNIPRSHFAGETPARSGTCIPTEKARRDLNASDWTRECF